MARINANFLKLQAGYLFPEIARRVNTFSAEAPQARIIKLGIGDVTEPLPETIVAAMRRAVDELGRRETFRGYPPEQGYDFLREAIVQHEYAARGCPIGADEIFVSDGSKCDTANILDILDNRANTIAVPDPVYPVYVDTNVMAGATGGVNERGEYEGLVYLPCTADSGFQPPLPEGKVDVIYLCYPNNPTGTVATRESLTRWVDYARANDALILYDAAYEAYITDEAIPHSIYEIEGAREAAIEFRSFSKKAGFTGVRCAFTVIPRELTGTDGGGARVDLHRLWLRRHATKFNGVSYITQRGAEAAYSPDGAGQVQRLVDFYLENARIIREGFERLGVRTFGGVNAPYIWLETPRGKTSWEFFDRLLREAHVVGTPGSGFGSCGEGFLRLSAFNSRENVEEAVARIARMGV